MSEGHLRKVGLLPARVAVELVDAPLKMGMIVICCGLVISATFVFKLTFVFLCLPQIC